MINFSENQAYNEMANRLLERLDYIRIQPKKILIVGLFLKNSQKKLQIRYPNAIIKSACDFSSINKFENNSIDLIIAHFALPREREPLHLLQEFFRVMRNEGLLLLTSLGPDTFFELRQSFAMVDHYSHTYTFMDMHHIGDWLRSLHFSDPVVDREEITLAYDDLNLFFEDLKNIGATYKQDARQRGLMSKNKWQKMLFQYEKFKTKNYFPVTLEVIYGHGWKVKLLENNDEFRNEIAISVDSIKRR